MQYELIITLNDLESLKKLTKRFRYKDIKVNVLINNQLVDTFYKNDKNQLVSVSGELYLWLLNKL